jgi:Flp pilus assembly protein TadD
MNKTLIIIFLIILIVYGCAPKKEVEQPKIITSMELPKVNENAQKKEEILKKVQLHIENREYEKAVLELNKAIELDPEDAALYYTLGDLYEQLGKDKESVEAFVKALQLDPEGRKISQEDEEVME